MSDLATLINQVRKWRGLFEEARIMNRNTLADEHTNAHWRIYWEYQLALNKHIEKLTADNPFSRSLEEFKRQRDAR